ncbi:hypothetical protein [Polaribacter porphyrae]|uniref:DUF3471 domain-containing protein n=1 Tax=Polaribacter porphyrae TaxID=1137780 RepID=A0A2S7WS20_9FLAO|nr:hypothetical protein [Polaribacter porphyrae]PQJ80112.1 hypothetical protein BTO18_13420 [Polaribacter porphyrae]
MKTLKSLTILALLLVQTVVFGQTKNTETIQKKESKSKKINTKNLKKFIGTYELTEANFTLDIIQEEGKMYIVTEFSKDELLLKDENTLHEFTRGVDLQLIEGNKNALKFTQNGYETTIERVKPKAKK